MRVGFSDPVGPRLWRMLPYAFPVLLIVAAIAFRLDGIPALFAWLGGLISFHLLGLVPMRFGKLRNADVECGAGYIEIKKAGSRNQRISAKDLEGATTARTRKGGLLLTLQHKLRPQPITLELEDDHAAEQVRRALGIGHGGFGTISWRTQADSAGRSAIVGRILVVICGLIALTLGLVFSPEAAFMSAFLLGQIALVGGVLGLIGLLGKPVQPSIMMGAEGLRLRTPRGWFALPYQAVAAVEDHQRGMVFTVPAPFNTVAVETSGPLAGGPALDERRVLVEQVRAAAQRAQGLGPHKDDVTGRIEVLRRHGESPRDWLVRLDMAGQMLSAGPGYRGHALEIDDLWAILEDPEADAELRAAAARVLRHAPATRVRIDAAVAAVRDETTNRRLRIAVDDNLDGASRELAFLDATEPRKDLHLQPMQVRR